MISFIIPTIWKAEEIYKSIEQFKRVKDKNVELIIVDNTHSDFYDSDPRITVVKCSKNIFVNPSWNIGVRLSRNKYVCLLNDDSLSSKTHQSSSMSMSLSHCPGSILFGVVSKQSSFR